MVAQGVSAHLTGLIREALLPQAGIKRGSKIIMCIGTKLCNISAKTANSKDTHDLTRGVDGSIPGEGGYE